TERQQCRQRQQTPPPIRVESVLADNEDQRRSQPGETQDAQWQPLNAACEQQRRGQNEHQDDQRVNHVLTEVNRSHDALHQGQAVARPDGLEQQGHTLGAALRPTRLLLLVRRNVQRKLSGNNNIRQIEETPAFQLCAIAQIEIFREGDILPAPCVQNGTHAPDAAGAVEVHQPSGAVAGSLFDDEMPIQRKALPHRQYIVFAVQVSPTRLYHAKLRIVYQRRDGSAQKIGIRCEVSIEDGDNFNAFEQRQPVCQRSGFVALPRAPAHMLNVQPTFLQLRDFVSDDRGGFVGRIVKYLNR